MESSLDQKKVAEKITNATVSEKSTKAAQTAAVDKDRESQTKPESVQNVAVGARTEQIKALDTHQKRNIDHARLRQEQEIIAAEMNQPKASEPIPEARKAKPAVVRSERPMSNSKSKSKLRQRPPKEVLAPVAAEPLLRSAAESIQSPPNFADKIALPPPAAVVMEQDSVASTELEYLIDDELPAVQFDSSDNHLAPVDYFADPNSFIASYESFGAEEMLEVTGEPVAFSLSDTQELDWTTLNFSDESVDSFAELRTAVAAAYDTESEVALEPVAFSLSDTQELDWTTLNFSDESVDSFAELRTAVAAAYDTESEVAMEPAETPVMLPGEFITAPTAVEDKQITVVLEQLSERIEKLEPVEAEVVIELFGGVLSAISEIKDTALGAEVVALPDKNILEQSLSELFVKVGMNITPEQLETVISYLLTNPEIEVLFAEYNNELAPSAPDGTHERKIRPLFILSKLLASLRQALRDRLQGTLGRMTISALWQPGRPVLI